MKIKAAIIHVSDCCSDTVVAAIMVFFFTGTSQTVVMGCDHFQTSLFFVLAMMQQMQEWIMLHRWDKPVVFSFLQT